MALVELRSYLFFHATLRFILVTYTKPVPADTHTGQHDAYSTTEEKQSRCDGLVRLGSASYHIHPTTACPS